MKFPKPFLGTPVSCVGAKGVPALIDSINEAAKQANTIALVFLATTIYLAVTAASTTDEQLLLNSPLTLPLLNVGVVVQTFYRVAPWLVVFLHLNLLLLEYVLAYRTHRLPEDVLDHRSTDSLFFFPSVIMRLGRVYHFGVRAFLRVLFMVAAVFLPAVVLVMIQVKFLPYHHEKITRWHQVAVASDLLLVWLFFLIRPRSGRRRTKREKWFRWDVAMFLLASGGLIAFSLGVAKIPGSCELTRIDRLLPHRNLWLSNRSFSANPPAEKGLSLAGRDLRCSDFSDSVMVNASFRGANLQGANFTGANLQGSDFTPLRGTPRSLLNLDLEQQAKKGIFYVPTILDKAIFSKADLRYTKFRSAEMRHAQMGGADLRAADFSSAHLNHADLAGARLFAADFTATEIRGASFQGAQMQGSKFPRAKAEYANFSGAILEGANLSFARADGAEFLGAFLQGAIGLPLQRLDLRNAKLAHADFCRSGDGPSYVDLRGAGFDEEPWSDLAEAQEGLATDLKKAAKNIDAAKTTPTCFYKGETLPSKALLYDKEQAQEGWPETQIDEGQYYSSLADELVGRICRHRDDDSLAVLEALVSRATERAMIDPEDSLAIKLVWRLRREMGKELAQDECVRSEKARQRIMIASSALCGAKRISPCFSR